MFSHKFFCLAIFVCAVHQIGAEEKTTSEMAKEAQTLLAQILRKGAIKHQKIADRVDNVIDASKDVASDGKTALWSSLKDVKNSAGESVGATKDFVKSGFQVGKDYLYTVVQIFIVPAKTTNAVVKSIVNKLSQPSAAEASKPGATASVAASPDEADKPADLMLKPTMPRIIYIDENNIRHEYTDDSELMKGLTEYLMEHAKPAS